MLVYRDCRARKQGIWVISKGVATKYFFARIDAVGRCPTLRNSERERRL